MPNTGSSYFIMTKRVVSRQTCKPTSEFVGSNILQVFAFNDKKATFQDFKAQPIKANLTSTEKILNLISCRWLGLLVPFQFQQLSQSDMRTFQRHEYFLLYLMQTLQTKIFLKCSTSKKYYLKIRIEYDENLCAK